MGKYSFLLERAHEVHVTNKREWTYDTVMQLNVASGGAGNFLPVCAMSSIITMSKTEAAPGDDDPDSDADLMY